MVQVAVCVPAPAHVQPTDPTAVSMICGAGTVTTAVTGPAAVVSG